MYRHGLAFVVLVLVAATSALGASSRAVGSHISQEDKDRFQSIFYDGLKSRDLQNNFYSAKHYPGVNAGESKAVCLRLVDLYGESKLNEFEKLFYFVGIFRQLKCSLPFPPQFDALIKESLTKDYNTAHEIYFSYMATKLLTEADVTAEVKQKIVKNLQTILKKDDSLVNLGYSFTIAADLGATYGQPIADKIAEVVAQADEVDGKMLQFEGGLSTTALVLNGALKLAQTLKMPSPIKADQAAKFANYLLSRRSVQTPKGISVLLEALTTLSQQTAVAPICLQIIGNGQILPESPVINLKVVDLVGQAVVPAVTAITGKMALKKAATNTLFSGAFVAKSSDKTVYSLDVSSAKPASGVYVVDVMADTAYSTQLTVRVLAKVKVNLLELGIGDSDSASALKMHVATFPKKLAGALSADAQQKIALKAVLVDEATGKPMTVHQAFVRFENKETKEEIIFVSESDSSKVYRFDLDLSLRGIDFGHKSGDYLMELIVGDSSISNSFKWELVDISLKFQQQSQQSSKTPCSLRKPKPEIHHLFREPEKRPPLFVSNLFTALCFAPLPILLLVWLKLKVNISNFPVSLSALGFHGGLGAILFLFYVFWLRLNMFETIRYLLPLALFTFVFGNRLLRSIANRKADK